MRKWGIVISAFYAVIVLFLLVPAGLFLCQNSGSLRKVFASEIFDAYGQWIV